MALGQLGEIIPILFWSLVISCFFVIWLIDGTWEKIIKKLLKKLKG